MFYCPSYLRALAEIEALIFLHMCRTRTAVLKYLLTRSSLGHMAYQIILFEYQNAHLIYIPNL